jgi:HlyD family secretion protein
MPAVRRSAAALLAIATLAFGIFAIPVSNGGPAGLTAHADFQALAESKLRDGAAKVKDAQSKIQSLIDRLRGGPVPDGISKSNGRIEATQVDVAAKYPGRLASVTVKEGDEVTAGQVIARISSPEFEAQLRGARAQVLKAKQAMAEAEALIAQRKSDQNLAKLDLERGQQLVKEGFLTRQIFDQRVAKVEVSDAGLRVAEAQREAAQFAIKTAEADVDRIDAMLVDLTLVAPRSGRVQYQLRRAGEVVDAGTRIVTILDLSDVYMTIYLPAAQAGLLALGDDARMTLDPFPQYVVPATIGFVAADAQFTPKSVETAEEREKLMFRIKLQVDPKVLGKYHTQVKTGVRGIGFVRTDAATKWPDDLTVRLP